MKSKSVCFLTATVCFVPHTELTKLRIRGSRVELSRGVGVLSFMELAFSRCFELFSTAVFSSTVFVTLFPTKVDTVNDDAVMASLTFYRFGGRVLVGHRYPPTHPFLQVPNQP